MHTRQLNQVGFGTCMYKGFEKNHLGETEILHHKVFLFIHFGYIGTRKLFSLEGRLKLIDLIFLITLTIKFTF